MLTVSLILLGVCPQPALVHTDDQPELTDAEALIERGEGWYAGGEYAKAVRDFTEAIKLDPKNPAVYVSRGLANWAIRDLDKPMADFDEAIRLDPKNPKAHFGRGATSAARMKWEEAIAERSEAIRLDPKYARAYAQRSYSRHFKGEREEGLEDEEQAVRLTPKSPGAVYTRGTARQGMGQWEKAVADFEPAIRLDPHYAYAYSNRALIRTVCPDPKFRDGEKTLKDAKQAYDLTGWKNADHIEAYAAAAAEAGEFDEAVKWQKKLLDDPEPLKWRGLGVRHRLELYEANKPFRMVPARRMED